MAAVEAMQEASAAESLLRCLRYFFLLDTSPAIMTSFVCFLTSSRYIFLLVGCDIPFDIFPLTAIQSVPLSLMLAFFSNCNFILYLIWAQHS